MRFLIGIFFLSAIFGLSLFGDYFMWHDITDARSQIQAREDLHKLASLSVQIFRKMDDPSEIAFWRALGGRAPLKDPWGTPYYLNAGHQSAEWISAGPDQKFGTEDDLRLKVPIGAAIPDVGAIIDEPKVSSAK